MKYAKIGKIERQGGFGVVHQVEDEKGSVYARKTFNVHPLNKSSEEHAKKRFVKEVGYQQQIKHPNVVSIVEIFKEETPPYFIMPWADASMADDMETKILNSENYMNCLYDIMTGLEELHSLGIYHRDLKPQNVLRFDEKYAIGDFGLISIAESGLSTLTPMGMVKSSDQYTAPEISQDLKSASIQSDIYSLGCILHDFVGVSNRIPCGEINESSEFGDILLAATRRDPTRRFKSVASFREALTDVLWDTDVVKTAIAEKILESL